MNETLPVTYEDARNAIESLLFVSKRPLSVDDIDEIACLGRDTILRAVEELSSSYETRGIQLIKIANGYLLATRPRYSAYIEKFLKSPVSVSLSQQSLETLSIIAYKQPVARAEIERIRGVLCDGVIKTLLDKRLIKEAGRSETVGRPILYATTVDFLKHFGLHDLGQLPLLEEKTEEL
ncbi:MAG: SMC-Scp complex subunit ScpB [Candidatus Margulisiibacteriota bacterium]